MSNEIQIENTADHEAYLQNISCETCGKSLDDCGDHWAKAVPGQRAAWIGCPQADQANRTPKFFRDFSQASLIARAFRAMVFGGMDKVGPIYSIRRGGEQFLTLAGNFARHADLLSVRTEEIT